MHIVVAQLPDGGEQIELSGAEEWVLPLVGGVLDGTPLSCTALFQFEKWGALVRVTGRVSAKAKCTCVRCGELFELSMVADTALSFRPSGVSAMPGDQELSQDELELGWYDDGRLQVEDVLSETLALALPERLVCLATEGCDKRTAALLASAQVEAPSGHPGFAALKNL